MTDYTKATGNAGTMMIRDTGTYVEAWIKCTSSGTFVNNASYTFKVNGTTYSGTYDYANAQGWLKLRSINVTTDQTVTFAIGDTGTNGLGGPTSMSASIARATIPSPPRMTITNITNTAFYNTILDGPNGGAAIDARQIGWSDASHPGTVQNLVSSDGSTQFTGFQPGTLYYLWARTHNVKGWSGWSSRYTITTKDVPNAPTTPVLSNVKQDSVHSKFDSQGDGGSTVLEWQTGYGKNPNTPELTISGSAPDITGLDPGMTYYFRGRGRNTYGWGPWSYASSVQLVAGAWVDVNGVKKRAVPYVKVAGVWKLAEPWVKIAGLWKVSG